MSQIPFPSGARLCGYVRDSGGRHQELSTEQQESRLAEFCKENGLLLTRLFRDDAISGGKVVGRRAFLEMIDHLESGAPESGVLLWSYSRFSRDYDDTQYFLARLRKAGKVIHSLSDSVPDTLDGRMLESMIAWKNAKYREDLSRDISRGLAYLVLGRKVWSGGHPPSGYRLEPVASGAHRDGRPRRNSRLVVDPLVAPQVRQAFSLRSQGATYVEIIQACPQLPKDRTAMAYLLRNPVYIGTGVFAGQEIPEYSEPLIDPDLWQAVQRVNNERSRASGPHHPRSVRSPYLLSGLVLCRICGQSMFGQSYSKHGYQYSYYRCQSVYEDKCTARLIPKDLLEQLVIQRLVESILQPDLLRSLIEEQQRSQSLQDRRQSSRLGEVNAELEALQSHIDRMVAAITDYGHSRALLTELAGLEEQQRQALRRQAEIHSQAVSYTYPDPDLLSRQSIAALHGASIPAQKEVLQSFIIDLEAERLPDRTLLGQLRYRLPHSELIGFADL